MRKCDNIDNWTFNSYNNLWKYKHDLTVGLFAAKLYWKHYCHLLESEQIYLVETEDYDP